MYKYPRPMVCVDCVVFKYENSIWPTHVLLIKRGCEPYKDCYALPGGFVGDNETITGAAQRELKEETGLDLKPYRMLGLYEDGEQQRDPRQPYVNSIGFYFEVHKEVNIRAGDDAADVIWYPIKDISQLNLAFDHKRIFNDAYNLINDLG